MSILKPNNDCKVIVGIEYAEMRVNNFDIVEIINNHNYSKSVVFASGRNWKKIEIAQLSASFTENDKISDAGVSVLSELSLIINGDNYDFRQILSILKEIPLILKINYNNGISKIIGNLQNFCHLSQKKDENGFLIENKLSFIINDKETSSFLE